MAIVFIVFGVSVINKRAPSIQTGLFPVDFFYTSLRKMKQSPKPDMDDPDRVDREKKWFAKY